LKNGSILILARGGTRTARERRELALACSGGIVAKGGGGCLGVRVRRERSVRRRGGGQEESDFSGLMALRRNRHCTRHGPQTQITTSAEGWGGGGWTVAYGGLRATSCP
jgi:hypothetical protein